jgi:hypothetical protein
VALGLFAFAAVGCAVPRLHPKTGKAYHSIFDQQHAKRKAKKNGMAMTGEEAEMALHNHQARTKYSETKSSSSSPSILQLPR